MGGGRTGRGWIEFLVNALLENQQTHEKNVSFIKKHNIGNLALSINDEIGFNPAKNGLHDVAFADLMVKKGRKAMSLHNDLVKRYIPVFSDYLIRG